MVFLIDVSVVEVLGRIVEAIGFEVAVEIGHLIFDKFVSCKLDERLAFVFSTLHTLGHLRSPVWSVGQLLKPSTVKIIFLAIGIRCTGDYNHFLLVTGNGSQ